MSFIQNLTRKKNSSNEEHKSVFHLEKSRKIITEIRFINGSVEDFSIFQNFLLLIEII